MSQLPQYGMMHRYWIAFWVVGLVVVGVWFGVLFWSAPARLQRRRRKSHTPLKAKANRPMVRFSVRPPKK